MATPLRLGNQLFHHDKDHRPGGKPHRIGENRLGDAYCVAPITPPTGSIIPDTCPYQKLSQRENLSRLKGMTTGEGCMNCLASPYYEEGGGTVIDWVPPGEDDVWHKS